MFAAKKRASAVDLLLSSFPAVQDTALRLSYKITLKPSLHIPITPEMRAAQVGFLIIIGYWLLVISSVDAMSHLMYSCHAMCLVLVCP